MKVSHCATGSGWFAAGGGDGCDNSVSADACTGCDDNDDSEGAANGDADGDAADCCGLGGEELAGLWLSPGGECPTTVGAITMTFWSHLTDPTRLRRATPR